MCSLHYRAISILLSLQTLSLVTTDYWTDRKSFIADEESNAVGASVVLSQKELIANDIIMNAKLQEFDRGFLDPSTFLPAQHFFTARPKIERSKVFNILQLLPKGASLHAHDLSLVSGDFVYNLTFSDKLYACTINDRLNLHFFEKPVRDNSCNWKLINELRRGNATYDEWVRSQLTLVVKNPNEVYTNINQIWKTFMDIFFTVKGMLLYKPIFKRYFYQALEEFYKDNIMYVEFRGILPPVYELNGTEYGPVAVAGIYEQIVNQFKEYHPDFHGARFIYAPLRLTTNKTANTYVKIAQKLKTTYPDFVAGFDLVGQEDLGLPLSAFIEQIQEISHDLKLFFHAGETNWYGLTSDFNLIDAVLLGTTRIGHGYAILKHPKVAQIVKDTGIGVEICPLSNQVLKLVDDLRNHPGSILIANGYPVIICNDDPSFWGAQGLSYDWYAAFMGMASREADLKFLKQLAINSIIYSAMDTSEQETVLEKWKLLWDIFINNIIQKHNEVSVHSVK